MKNKKFFSTYILIAVLLILIGGILFVNNSKEQEKQVAAEKSVYENFDVSDIDKIEIIEDQKTVTIYKNEDKWMKQETIEEEVKEYEVEEPKVTAALSKIASLKVTEPVTTSEDKQALFEVDDEHSKRIKLYNQEKVIVDLHIGKITSDFTGSYFRLEGEDAIFKSKESLSSAFNPTVFKEIQEEE